MIVDPGCRCGTCRFQDPERRVDVGLHGGVEVVVGNVEDRCARLLSSSVTHHDIEPAQPVDGARHEAAAELRAAQVTRNGDALAARLLDQRDDLSRVRLFARQIVDRHVRAFAGEGDGGGATHAGVAAGDQRLSAAQPSGTDVARFAMIRSWVHAARQARPCLRLLGERRSRVLVPRIALAAGRGLRLRLGGSGRERG